MRILTLVCKFVLMFILMSGCMLAAFTGIMAYHDYTVGGAGTPEISLTHLSVVGDTDGYITGLVNHSKPTEQKLAIFIYVNGWRTKPYWAGPNIIVGRDGGFSCDITTDQDDEKATKIAVYLVPLNMPIPPLVDQEEIPKYFLDKTLAHITVNR